MIHLWNVYTTDAGLEKLVRTLTFSRVQEGWAAVMS